jgi:hypothetical protein
MVGVARIELATPAMSTQCSTTELYAHAARPLAAQMIPFKPESQGSSHSKLSAGAFLVEHALHLQHQILQVEGLGQDFCLRHRLPGAEGNA